MTRARELAELGSAYDSGTLSNRNMIINGSMVCSQRGASLASATTNAFLLDRIRYEKSGVSTVVTMSQATDAPDGVSDKSLKFQVTTAGSATPGAGHFHQFIYKMEGTSIDHIKLGTSGCQPMVFSFYAKASTTGTLPVSLHNNTGVTVFSTTYNIATANTWERYIVKLPAITTGTWQTGTSEALAIRFGLEYGSDFTGGTPDQWRTLASGFTGSGGFQSAYTNTLGSTLNATLNITGIQLEMGTEATPFETTNSFSDELQRCQRYYNQIQKGAWGVGAASGTPVFHYFPPVKMRVAPSYSLTVNKVSMGDMIATGFDLTGATISANTHNTSSVCVWVFAASSFSNTMTNFRPLLLESGGSFNGEVQMSAEF